MYGGLSETTLEHHKEEGFVRLKSRLIRERQGLVLPTNLMFSGFEHNDMFKREFYMFNGIRVTMRPPEYPCKVGLHIKMNIGNDNELFTGLILDQNNPRKDQWIQYELPINCLKQDFVHSQIINPNVDNTFEAMGVNLMIESDKEVPVRREHSKA
mmetsp:Transcript_6827/g.11523  ORF Transcript_6827/g.11523 Transcript_6827/m.11523 type:complete len:155 (-) Transcript_6827:318-782(-)